ncbi:hypothetical protein JTE90_020558 [Oedothorax gibbosus]|uniref:Uncharacterized protein n=1 Tax=Oedothorax gibbosus TaxID=931172 RepID=A0AAV6VXX5_9ARAC|nr:hypothetical protein JTE90_020558 [Oedothorax gibbosus]
MGKKKVGKIRTASTAAKQTLLQTSLFSAAVHIIVELVVPRFLLSPAKWINLSCTCEGWHFEVSDSSRELRSMLINQQELINCLQIQIRKRAFSSLPSLFRFPREPLLRE